MASFFNQATLSYNGLTVNSNTVTGEIIGTFTVDKQAVNVNYKSGGTVTYIVTGINSSANPLTNLTMTDNLGGFTGGGTTLYPLSYSEGTIKYFINGVLQPNPAVTEGPPMTISGITVPAGGNITIIYDADVTGFAPLETGGKINNTVRFTGGGLTAPVEAEENISVEESPLLSITKSLSPVQVSENGQITYTFVIQNAGNTEATADDNIVVSDVFNPILKNIAVSYNSAAWTEPANYSYDETTGAFATVPGQITVPAATYTTSEGGSITVVPGTSTLVITGTI